MKISRKSLSVLLYAALTITLIITAILLARTPVEIQDSWSGANALASTTPTTGLFQDKGWWTSMPTAPGLGGLPTPSETPTP